MPGKQVVASTAPSALKSIDITGTSSGIVKSCMVVPVDKSIRKTMPESPPKRTPVPFGSDASE
jgi:hypothetical protein